MGRECVLVVDDEAFVAYDFADIVEETGREVLGPAVTLAEARGLVSGQLPDIALLDINVRGETIWSLARELRAGGCTAIFVSADPRPEVGTEFADCTFLPKPASVRAIRAALDCASAGLAPVTASGPASGPAATPHQGPREA